MTAGADLYFQPDGKGVYHGSTHAVKTAGHFVAAAAELAAGVQNSVHHRDSRQAGLLLDAHGDAAAVIGHADDLAGQDLDLDFVTEAGQRFVNGVVHDLIDQMVQSSGTGGADVHTRALADRFQSFQYLNLAFVVILIGLRHIAEIQNITLQNSWSPPDADPLGFSGI